MQPAYPPTAFGIAVAGVLLVAFGGDAARGAGIVLLGVAAGPASRDRLPRGFRWEGDG
jgi:hypothetical protein